MHNWLLYTILWLASLIQLQFLCQEFSIIPEKQKCVSKSRTQWPSQFHACSTELCQCPQTVPYLAKKSRLGFNCDYDHTIETEHSGIVRRKVPRRVSDTGAKNLLSFCNHSTEVCQSAAEVKNSRSFVQDRNADFLEDHWLLDSCILIQCRDAPFDGLGTDSEVKPRLTSNKNLLKRLGTNTWNIYDIMKLLSVIH